MVKTMCSVIAWHGHTYIHIVVDRESDAGSGGLPATRGQRQAGSQRRVATRGRARGEKPTAATEERGSFGGTATISSSGSLGGKGSASAKLMCSGTATSAQDITAQSRSAEGDKRTATLPRLTSPTSPAGADRHYGGGAPAAGSARLKVTSGRLLNAAVGPKRKRAPEAWGTDPTATPSPASPESRRTRP